MLKSNLCDYSDVYILVKGAIDLSAAAVNENVKDEENFEFKNNAPFRSCISKINSTLIDNLEDLDIVMPMHNLLEHSQNYSMTSESLQNYCRDDNASDGKSFKYKTKIVEKTRKTSERSLQPVPNLDGSQPEQPPQLAAPTLNVDITIPLKYLSNSWRFIDLPLINCEIELDLTWTKDCVFIEHHNNITVVNFMISSTKLYVPVVTLSIDDNIKLLENIKQGFRRTICLNKYRSEIITQLKKQ